MREVDVSGVCNCLPHCFLTHALSTACNTYTFECSATYITFYRSRLSKGQHGLKTTSKSLALLRDLDQPFVYDIRM